MIWKNHALVTELSSLPNFGILYNIKKKKKSHLLPLASFKKSLGNWEAVKLMVLDIDFPKA